jgi:hypothetical protein
LPVGVWLAGVDVAGVLAAQDTVAGALSGAEE